jgi:hypothetical protein
MFSRRAFSGDFAVIGAVDPTVCGKPGTSDGPRSTRVVHVYGDLRGLRGPPLLFVCKCQRHAALQHPAAGRCGGLDNASKLSLRIKGELADAADGSKYAGRSPLKMRYDAPSIDATSEYRRARGCGRRSSNATFSSESCLKEL